MGVQLPAVQGPVWLNTRGEWQASIGAYRRENGEVMALWRSELWTGPWREKEMREKGVLGLQNNKGMETYTCYMSRIQWEIDVAGF